MTIAAPSAAAGALTRYVLGFNVSATGGLSGEAGSTITVSLPFGTTSAGWQGGTVRNVTTNTDVGTCPQPSGLTTTCSFFSCGVVSGGDQLQITLRGLTNGAAARRREGVDVERRDRGDVRPVHRRQRRRRHRARGGHRRAFRGRGRAHALRDRLPRVRHGRDVRRAASSISVTLPAGTGTAEWQGGTVRNVTTAADVGGCPRPINDVTRCTFFSARW